MKNGKRTSFEVLIDIYLLIRQFLTARSLIGDLLITLFLCGSGSASQNILPDNGSILTTTQVLFQWEPTVGTRYYDLEVTRIGGEDASSDSVIALIEVGSDLVLLGYIFDFGHSYRWRTRAVNYLGTPGSWDAVRSFAIDSLPRVPFMEIKQYRPLSYQPGLTLFHGWVLDRKGRVIMYPQRDAPSPRWSIRFLPNGHLLYLSDGYIYETSLDQRTVYFRSTEGDHHHDVQPMPDGGYLSIQHDKRELPLGDTTVEWWGDEVNHYGPDGGLLWTWNVFDHLSTSDVDTAYVRFAENIGFFDWVRINACLYDPEDNSVLLSLRNISRILKIDYNSRNTVWSMGAQSESGGAQFGNGLFYYQHAPELLANGNILLFDNAGSDLTKPPLPNSRAVELALDNPTNPQSASIVWKYELDYFAFIYGDADRLPNGNTLITGAPSDGSDNWIHEVTPGGDLVWELKTGLGLYRAERIASLYPQAFLADKIKPIFSEVGPAPDCYINSGRVSYSLSETLLGGRATFRRTGGVADPGSPHVSILYGSELNAGSHGRVFLTDQPTLVEGAVYSISFDGVDYASNVAETATVDDIMTDLSPPREPSNLTATTGIDTVSLTWSANQEEDLSHYILHRSTNEAGSPTQPILTVSGSDTVAFDIDTKVKGIYWYWVQAVDLAENASPLSAPDSAAVEIGWTGIDKIGEGVPAEFNLGQNYPNPFNPRTTIEFALPGDSFVSLVVYNAFGQAVRELASGRRAAGSHKIEWDGRDDYGRMAGSGVYFYRLQTGEFSRTRKMVLLK